MRLASLFVGTALLTASLAAHADLLGNTVTCAQVGPGSFTCNVPSITVAPGNEFQIGPGTNDISAVFNATSLTLDFNVTGGLAATILDFQDTTSAFTTESLMSQTGITGFSASNITLSAGVLSVDLENTVITDGGDVVINLANAATTPEPSSLVLFGSGLMGVAALARRRFV